jgi:hypothetical protein
MYRCIYIYVYIYIYIYIYIWSSKKMRNVGRTPWCGVGRMKDRNGGLVRGSTEKTKDKKKWKKGWILITKLITVNFKVYWRRLIWREGTIQWKLNFERNGGRKISCHILMHYSDIRAESMITQSVVGVPLLTHPPLFTLIQPPIKSISFKNERHFWKQIKHKPQTFANMQLCPQYYVNHTSCKSFIQMQKM